MTPGSNESLDLLKNLVEADPDIFRTSIKEIVDYKWQSYNWLFKLQSLIYYSYLSVIGLSILYYDSFILTVLVLLLTTLMIIYEGVQCKTNWSYYVTDFWNLFDLSGFIIVFTYCLLREIDISFDWQKEMFGLGLFIVFLRGISYLRPFDKTRYLVGMITEIIKDMMSFFIVLVYSIVGLAFI